jgi:hypothetical protein
MRLICQPISLWLIERLSMHLLHYQISAKILYEFLIASFSSIFLGIYFFRQIWDHFSQPYKETGRIIDLYIFIFSVLESGVKQALPQFILLLISSWHSFMYVVFLPRYLYFDKFANKPLILLQVLVSSHGQIFHLIPFHSSWIYKKFVTLYCLPALHHERWGWTLS